MYPIKCAINKNTVYLLLAHKNWNYCSPETGCQELYASDIEVKLNFKFKQHPPKKRDRKGDVSQISNPYLVQRWEI